MWPFLKIHTDLRRSLFSVSHPRVPNRLQTLVLPLKEALHKSKFQKESNSKLPLWTKELWGLRGRL
jgi:hypothetical protein